MARARYGLSFPVKVMAMILAAAFFAQDLSWAYPDRFAYERPGNNKLAPAPFSERHTLEYKVTGSLVVIIERNRTIPIEMLTLEGVEAILRKNQEFLDKNGVKFLLRGREMSIYISEDAILRYADPGAALKDIPDFVIKSQKKAGPFIRQVLRKNRLSAALAPEQLQLDFTPESPTKPPEIKLPEKTGDTSVFSPAVKAPESPDKRALSAAKKRREIELLDSGISKNTKLLFAFLGNKMHRSYAIAGLISTLGDDITKYDYVRSQAFESFSRRVYHILIRWRMSDKRKNVIVDRLARISERITRRDALSMGIDTSSYPGVEEHIGSSARRNIIFMLSGIELELMAVTEEMDERSTLGNRYGEIANDLRMIQELVKRQGPRPIRDLGSCEAALRATAKHIILESRRDKVLNIADKMKALKPSVEKVWKPSSPAGSIAGVFEYLCSQNITAPEISLGADEIARGLDRSYETIKYDLRALYYHLSLLNKTDTQKSGRDARYYVPESVKKKAGDIYPILKRFTRKKLRPAKQDLMYAHKIIANLIGTRDSSTRETNPVKISRSTDKKGRFTAAIPGHKTKRFNTSIDYALSDVALAPSADGWEKKFEVYHQGKLIGVCDTSTGKFSPIQVVRRPDEKGWFSLDGVRYSLGADYAHGSATKEVRITAFDGFDWTGGFKVYHPDREIASYDKRRNEMVGIYIAGKLRSSDTGESLRDAKQIDTVSDGDITNAFILAHIDEDRAIELNDKDETIVRVRRDRSNPRDPPLEDILRSTGVFSKIRSAKDPLLLRKITGSKTNLSNLTPSEQDDLIVRAQNTSLSLILGHSLIGEDEEEHILCHVRTGFNKSYPNSEPTVWIGANLLARITVEELARLLLEMAQHLIKPYRYVDGRQMNLHWVAGMNEYPLGTVKHDPAFVRRLYELAASTAIDKTARSLRSETSVLSQSAEHMLTELQDEREKVLRIHGRWPPAVVVFGSARIPEDHPVYELARQFGRTVYKEGWPIRTGAGPSMMEAPLKGYIEAREESGASATAVNTTQGVRIDLGFEQSVNRWVEDNHTFNYFYMRKVALYDDSIGIVIFPGGFGTMDELFEAMCRNKPIVFMGKDYWQPIIDVLFDQWKEAGLLDYVGEKPLITDDKDEAVAYLRRHAGEGDGLLTGQTAAKINLETRNGIMELSGWQPGIAVLGGPIHDLKALDKLKNISSQLASHGIRICVGTRVEPLKRAIKAGIGSGEEERLRSIIYSEEEPLRIQYDENASNSFIAKDLSNHRMMLAENSTAFILFPGEKKTMSMLLGILTIMQTGKGPRRLIILFGSKFWKPIKDIIVRSARSYTEEGLIGPDDADYMQIADTPEEVMDILGLQGSLPRPAEKISETPDTVKAELAQVRVLLRMQIPDKVAEQSEAAFTAEVRDFIMRHRVILGVKAGDVDDILNEIGFNIIEHGNGGEITVSVERLASGRSWLKIIGKDEGNGFTSPPDELVRASLAARKRLEDAITAKDSDIVVRGQGFLRIALDPDSVTIEHQGKRFVRFTNNRDAGAWFREEDVADSSAKGTTFELKFDLGRELTSRGPEAEALADINDLFRSRIPAQINGNTKILLSEGLFTTDGDEAELAQVRIALAPILKSGYIAIMKPDEMRRSAMNRNVSKDKLAIVLTKEDFGNEEIWRGCDKETSIKSSVLILDGRLTGNNYLYLEGVIGLAQAMMENNKPAIKRYYGLISGADIGDDIMALLNDVGQNNISFAIRAMLRFKLITRIDPEDFNERRIRMENFLISA